MRVEETCRFRGLAIWFRPSLHITRRVDSGCSDGRTAEGATPGCPVRWAHSLLLIYEHARRGLFNALLNRGEYSWRYEKIAEVSGARHFFSYLAVVRDLPAAAGAPLPRFTPRHVALHRMRRLQEDLCKPPAEAENCDRLKIDGISRGPRARVHIPRRPKMKNKGTSASGHRCTCKSPGRGINRDWVGAVYACLFFPNPTDKADWTIVDGVSLQNINV